MLELLESNIHKLCKQLHEYIYLNDSYSTEILHTLTDELKSNINKLLEVTDQNNKD